MMIHDFQFYSFVDDKGFNKLMQQLEPRYEIPHRTTFSRIAMYQEVKQKVEVKLTKMQSKLALTTNMWTSEANDPYLGLSCH